MASSKEYYTVITCIDARTEAEEKMKKGLAESICRPSNFAPLKLRILKMKISKNANALLLKLKCKFCQKTLKFGTNCDIMIAPNYN